MSSKPDYQHPPRLAEWLVRWFFPDGKHSQRLGDMGEVYSAKVASDGRWSAGLWYWQEALKVLPSFIRNRWYWRRVMFQSLLKSAWRHLKKYRVYSVINILGLSVALAGCMLVFLWVFDECGYDRFHEKADTLHKVYSELIFDNGSSLAYNVSYYPLATLLKNEIPEIRHISRFHTQQGLTFEYGDVSLTREVAGFTEPSFFRMFSFPMIAGEPESAMEEKFSVILSRSMANRLFGDEEPVGKMLTVNGAVQILVTGVMEDVPRRSSLQFDCILPFVLLFPPDFQMPTHWGGNPMTTFVQLHEGQDPSLVESKISQRVAQAHPRESSEEHFCLQPLKKMHLYFPGQGGLIQTLIIFSLVAVVVLIIACINYLNLSTARASTRLLEVGVRKVMGANRRDLIRQFMAESVTLAFVSLVFAVILVLTLLPEFSQLIGKPIKPNQLFNLPVLAAFLLMTLVTGVMSGFYPALVLSALRPVNAMKGESVSGNGGAGFRRILVVIQFSLSIALIIFTLSLSGQIRFMAERDLGFDSDNLYNVRLSDNLVENYGAIRNRLLQDSQIVQVSKSLQNPAYIGSTVGAVNWDGKDPALSVNFNWDVVDYGYIETLGYQVLEGRSFSPNFSTDGDAYLINEEAARVMGMDSPVGKRLSVFKKEGRIIGVLKNFHFQPLKHEIKPFVFMINESWSGNMFIRIRPEEPKAAVARIRDVLADYETDRPAQVRAFKALLLRWNYQTERKISKISRYLALLAVMISCLGLFGLTSFMVLRRTKEIGIRKVLGASNVKIVSLLLGDISRWVLLSNVLAWPLAFLVVRQFFSGYAFRAPFSWSRYLFSGGVALGIALVTAGVLAIRASLANPAHSLKYE